MLSNDRAMPTCRRERKDHVDRPNWRTPDSLHESLPLDVQLADDLLKAGEPRFDLDEDRGGRTVEAQFHRTATRPRHRRLDGRPPAPVPPSKELLDDARLSGVPDQRTRSFESRHSQVGPENCRDPERGSKRDARVALFEPAHDGSADANRVGDGCLGDPGPQAERPELLGGPGQLTAKGPISVADRRPVLGSMHAGQ